jgi:hypothetical protein
MPLSSATSFRDFPGPFVVTELETREGGNTTPVRSVTPSFAAEGIDVVVLPER